MAKLFDSLTYAQLNELPDETFLQVQKRGNFYGVTLGVLREATSGHSVQGPVVSTTGQTVVLTDTAKNNTLYITPAGTLAALTVTLPTNGNSNIGQTVTIFSTQIITSLTISGAGATVQGNVTTLAANAFVSFRKVAANTWARVA